MVLTTWRLQPFSAAALTSAGIIAAIIILRGIRKRRDTKADILARILEQTAPVVAAQELQKDGTALCERRLGGRQLVIAADPRVADYVFNGINKRNFVQRPAQDEGLESLRMLNRGLIWNNDLHVWQSIRGCFQRALDHNALQHAVAVAKEECHSLLKAKVHHGATKADMLLNLLEISRKVTFRATLSVFFGIQSCDFQASGINEDDFIAAIVAYFKAWEYFLFRSARQQEGSGAEKHHSSVAALQGLVKGLLTATCSADTNEMKESGTNNKKPLFIDHAREACLKLYGDPNKQQALLEQSALEMLLAGTDTSSVTAYYSLLGLAADPVLQHDLREECKQQGNKAALLDSLIRETLRFKPVGPIVLRQAVKADPSFPGTSLQAGAAILVHLAEMNLQSELWTDPHSFQPRRFLQDENNGAPKIFFPFGDGPKGCIGMHLGKREVAAIVETVVLHYDMSLHGVETLQSLDTHWDIANQPDNPALIRLSSLAEASE